MASRRSLRWLGRGVAAAMVGAMAWSAFPTPHAGAVPWGNRAEFAAPEFRSLWNETDASPGNRSLTWGPAPWWDYKEFYKDSPGGTRTVQYYDKARMEINNPDAQRTRFFVTNGLLPVEMISGRLKLGNGETDENYDDREPAAIPVAGDLAKVNPNAPTYASFRLVATTSGNNQAQPRLGQRVNATFDKAGNIGVREDLATDATEIVQFNANTGHNVPEVFKTYMDYYDRAGGVGSLFTFGYPITEPYWVRARVGGQDKDVMIQIFERRVLTYTPTNPAQYQVEMGNVGQHYFQWRYANQGTPWDPETPPYFPVAFASNRPTQRNGPPLDHFEIYTTDVNGASQNPITSSTAESRPFSVLRSWDQDEIRIIGDSTRNTNPAKSRLWSFKLDGSDPKAINTYAANTAASAMGNDYNGAASPDGTKIIFVSDRDGNPELFIVDVDGGTAHQLTNTAAPCANEYPSWFPDGSGVYWSTNCDYNNWEVVKANVRYTKDQSGTVEANLSTKENLTNNAKDDRYPRVSPAGSKLAFSTNRDADSGNKMELYVMSPGSGTGLQRLTYSENGNDVAPTWSPDSLQIIYQSDIEGDNEIYVRTLDPNTAPRQLTNNSTDDQWPVWAQ